MSITREQLLKRLEIKWELVPVDGLGEIGIKSYDEVLRAKRMAAANAGRNSKNETAVSDLRLWEIIDRVTNEKREPLFTAVDIDDLRAKDSRMIDCLCDAIESFDSRHLMGNGTGESSA